MTVRDFFFVEKRTFDSNMGSAIMKCSVNLFLSSIWVFLSFAVKTCKRSKTTEVNTISAYSMHYFFYSLYYKHKPMQVYV